MNAHTSLVTLLALGVLALASAGAGAQMSIDWSTIDCGGGTVTAGTLAISGTIAQPDAAATLAGGTFELTGGFWPVTLPTTPPCPADFNADGFINPDDLADFITCFFLNVQFPGSCPAADFNGDVFVNPDDLADFITTFFITVQFGC